MNISRLGKYEASKFILNEILLVPNASRNLLSIKQLYADNKVYLEFDKQTVKVHDLGTR